MNFGTWHIPISFWSCGVGMTNRITKCCHITSISGKEALIALRGRENEIRRSCNSASSLTSLFISTIKVANIPDRSKENAISCLGSYKYNGATYNMCDVRYIEQLLYPMLRKEFSSISLFISRLKLRTVNVPCA